VLVLAGDHVYRMDYRRLLQTHELRGATATLAVTRVPPDQSRRFGMVYLDRDGRIARLDEKPAQADTPFASMGVYLFEAAALGQLLRERPRNLVLDVIQPMLRAGEPVYAHEFTGYWEDVGTLPAYYRASLGLLADPPRLELHDPRWPLLTRDEERAPANLREGADVEESLVANGCTVAGRVRRSLLFPGVVVEPGAEVSDSIIMQDVRIGRGARVDRSILDKYTQVGEGAAVGWGDPPHGERHAWLEGLTLAGKDAHIPPGCRVGRGVVLGIGARLDPQGREVPAGTLIEGRAWYEDMV
jgi:glucose-1-phosphate adenylyltransferase